MTQVTAFKKSHSPKGMAWYMLLLPLNQIDVDFK